MDNRVRLPLGIKIIMVLFCVFGVIGVLVLLYEAAELAYLPSNLRIIISAVTALDSIVLFVMGAGLLTMKRKWIDAVIIISFISIVAFYIVPLRLAIPLEVVIIIYLVNWRGGFSLDRLKHAAPLGLLMLSCSTAFTANAHLSAPDRNLVQYYTQTSNQGYFTALMQLYQYEDAMSATDFYNLEIRIRCPDRKFNHITVNASTPNPEAEADWWHPVTKPGSTFSVGLGVATFSIGPSENIDTQHGKNNSYVCWTESLMTPTYDAVFSSDFWVPEGTNLPWTLTVEAKLENEIFGTLWSDTLTFTSAS